MDTGSYWLGIGAGILGRGMVDFAGFLWKSSRKPKEPKVELPPRQVGDLVYSIKGPLPVVLLEQLTYDQFRAQFITPRAAQLGAKVKDESSNELEDFLVVHAHDRTFWKDYTRPLSDGEHRNYAKAMMLKDEK